MVPMTSERTGMKHTEFDLVVILAHLIDTEDDPIDGLDDVDEFVSVEEGEWTADHKYQGRTDVFLHKTTGRFVAVNQSRSGSYHSDYEYTEPTVCEVFPHSKTITTYTTTP